MKKMKRMSTVVLAMMMVAAASAQDEPPAQDPEETAPPPVAPSKFRLLVGWADWNLNGNQNKFRQYATPPSGFHIREISYGSWTTDLRYGGKADARSPGEDDYRVAVYGSADYGRTRIWGDTDRHRFFHRTPVVIPASQRRGTEGYVRHDVVRDGLAISMRSRTEQEDRHSEPPFDSLHQRTQLWSASATGSIGQGFYDLTYTDFRYYDRTEVQPDSATKRWGFSYAHSFGHDLNLVTGFVRNTVEIAGAENRVEGWSVSGDWSLGPNSMAVVDYRRDRLNLPTVRNAYTRERSMARGRFIQRIGTWTAQLGYGRFDYERIRGDQQFVDTPRWHTFEGRLSGRVSPDVRVSARIGRHSLQGSAQMSTLDPRPLYWDDRAFGELKIDGGTELVQGYLVFGVRENRNDPRATRVRNTNLTIGASLQSQPNLELFFEGVSDVWSARSADPENPDLDRFFGDGGALTLGANWSVNPQLYATASFT
ncbi:MAG TPA: hypothetical protein VM328_04695, partial [Fimbriimonadaceae bacterium]|nr:hypothetical protein [Fimbriimonadaceae bacterium]